MIPLYPLTRTCTLTFSLWNNRKFGIKTQLGYSTVTIQKLLNNESTNLESPILDSKTNEIVGELFLDLQIRRMPIIDPFLIDSNLFESPVHRLGVSGGTAPFFELILTKAGCCKLQHSKQVKCCDITKTHYIGKDYSHALDEIDFYEEIRLMKLSKNDDDKPIHDLITFMFDYIGILESFEQVDSERIPRKMLVLQNLRDGCKKLRLLDLKIGQKTAQAGWQGKTRLRAFKQAFVDNLTNSGCEGYRLEGFDGMPEVLLSMDPLMENAGKFPSLEGLLLEAVLAGDTAVAAKKARRMMLQKMTGNEIFMHFLDLHQEKYPLDPTLLGEMLTFTELSEIVLHEIVLQLFRLSFFCHKLPVPQKWIGSSVALGFDALARSPRSREGEEHIRSTVIVNIFDWGRSELMTKQKFCKLSAEEKTDREKFWNYFKSAIDQLSLTAAVTYWNRFSNDTSWDEVTIRVFDFDGTSADDYIGEMTLPLQQGCNTMITTHPLKRPGPLSYNKSFGSIRVQLSWNETPNSRIRGTWRLRILSAACLPAKDFPTDFSTATSDPYCLVIAKSKAPLREFRQVTSVKLRDLNPVWDETLDIPVAANASFLMDSLKAEGLDVELLSSSHSDFFEMNSSASQNAQRLIKWANALDKA